MKLLTPVILLGACCVMQAVPLTISRRVISQLESGTFTVMDLNWGGEKFSLVPPPGATLEMDEPAGRVIFVFSNYISVSLTLSTNKASADTATFARNLLPVAEVRIAEEFLAHCGDARGRGVELNSLLRGHEIKCRAAVFPIKGGTATIVLNCGAGEIEAGRQAFGALMTSFHHTKANHSQR